MNEFKSKPSLIQGQGEIIKKDGTKIPITLTANTDLSYEEVVQKTGLPITKQEKE